MSKYFSVGKFNDSNWGIAHTKSGRQVSWPTLIDHPKWGIVEVQRELLFSTYMEALTYLAEHSDAMDFEYEIRGDEQAFFS